MMSNADSTGTTPDTSAEGSGTDTGTPPESDGKSRGTSDDTSGTDTGQAGTSDSEAPPWDRAGEAFDPQRAWQLIQNLRSEVADAKRISKTGAGELVDRVSALENQLTAASAAVARERVGRQHNLPDEVVALLGDGDEETLSARAAALLKWADNRDTDAAPVKKRAPARTRGSTPQEMPAETDPAKLAEQVIARRGH